MFGYVQANTAELTKAQLQRYQSVYCGVCRRIREQTGQLARVGLRYDMAFLSLLLMSLYEPEEASGDRACALHPAKPRAWVDADVIRYAADMNTALAYYKAMDDYADERKPGAKMLASIFGKDLDRIAREYPRQCRAMESTIAELAGLEKGNCPNPDEPANVFGRLMAELLVYREDLWAPTLRKMGLALGRFIYLGDAIVDYRRDRRKHKYNPYLAMGEADPRRFEEHLILAMGDCTAQFEKLPLVQDKHILDNILYSGVWCSFRRMKNERRDGVDP